MLPENSCCTSWSWKPVESRATSVQVGVRPAERHERGARRHGVRARRQRQAHSLLLATRDEIALLRVVGAVNGARDPGWARRAGRASGAGRAGGAGGALLVERQQHPRRLAPRGVVDDRQGIRRSAARVVAALDRPVGSGNGRCGDAAERDDECGCAEGSPQRRSAKSHVQLLWRVCSPRPLLGWHESQPRPALRKVGEEYFSPGVQCQHCSVGLPAATWSRARHRRIRPAAAASKRAAWLSNSQRPFNRRTAPA